MHPWVRGPRTGPLNGVDYKVEKNLYEIAKTTKLISLYVNTGLLSGCQPCHIILRQIAGDPKLLLVGQ
jgi:hypothetical protein